MESEVKHLNSIKKYFEGLGYPKESILFDYTTSQNKRIDAVIKTDKGVLVAIEIKDRMSLDWNSKEEIGYHPITRRLQKEATELEAKYFILSNGKDNVWLQTGDSGRPEHTSEIRFSQFNANILSEAKFAQEILSHVAEYLKNFPITGDGVFDISLVFYFKLVKELNLQPSTDIDEIIQRNTPRNSFSQSYSPKQILQEAVYRLDSFRFIDNRLAVMRFIDEFLERNKQEWNLPRWLGDFMVKVLDSSPRDKVVDLFARFGVLTSSALLSGKKNITSYFSNQQEFYWIKVQQLLALDHEVDIQFAPSLQNGQLDFLEERSVDGVLLSPPFNLKFNYVSNSYLSDIGIKDSSSILIELALRSLRYKGRLVAIVPDSLLQSSQLLKVRSFLLNKSRIEAIISLPTDAFKPFSSIKTSIISIETNSASADRSCFFASIKDSPKGELKIGQLNELLNKLSDFRKGRAFSQEKKSFVIEEINADSFHFSKYYLDSQSLVENNLHQEFMAIPLKELAIEINIGGAMVSDPETGEIPYIGPGAIRNMRLIKENFTYTSKDKLPNRLRYIERGDVLVNAIGRRRGSATVVNSEFEGLAINRHIISLKPNLNLVLPGYLATALNSKFVQDQFFDQSTGSVILSLNKRSLEDVYIPVPNIEEQERIYNDYSRLLDELDRSESKITSLKSKLNQKLSQLGREGGNS